MRLSAIRAVALSAALSLPAFAADSSSPDSLITTKAKLGLWTTAGVKSTTVHVDTTDGVVTLYGKVPSDSQKQLAEKTAAQVNGVKSVKNLLQVVPEAAEKTVARNDKEVKDAAEKMLKNDAALKDSKLEVKSVDKGVVLLSGEAATMSDHLRAVSSLYRVPGVQRVATEAKAPDRFENADERMTRRDRAAAGGTAKAGEGRVEGKAERAEAKTDDAKNSANDMRITSAVKLKLWTTPQVPSTDINVDTDGAEVTLFGMVPTQAIKNTAGDAAARVSGVKRVENQLEVVPTSEKKFVEQKDQDITKSLDTAFKDREGYRDVKYAVRNGTVRLTGRVDSGIEELNAVRLARQVAGVRTVENDLTLEDRNGSKETLRRY